MTILNIVLPGGLSGRFVVYPQDAIEPLAGWALCHILTRFAFDFLSLRLSGSRPGRNAELPGIKASLTRL